jgi:hypothetical protein
MLTVPFTSVYERRSVPSVQSVPVDLVATKLPAGRPKDIEDVRGILRERLPALDLELVRTTLALPEEAPGQSDLRPVLERKLALRRGQPG